MNSIKWFPRNQKGNLETEKVEVLWQWITHRHFQRGREMGEASWQRQHGEKALRLEFMNIRIYWQGISCQTWTTLKKQSSGKRGHVGESKRGDFNKDLQKYYHAEYELWGQSIFHVRFQFPLSNRENKYSQDPSVNCKLINFKSLLNNLGNFFLTANWLIPASLLQ